MINDPELKTLIDEPVAIRWVGPDAHIVVRLDRTALFLKFV